jgi:hypothetical protein
MSTEAVNKVFANWSKQRARRMVKIIDDVLFAEWWAKQPYHGGPYRTARAAWKASAQQERSHPTKA